MSGSIVLKVSETFLFFIRQRDFCRSLYRIKLEHFRTLFFCIRHSKLENAEKRMSFTSFESVEFIRYYADKVERVSETLASPITVVGPNMLFRRTTEIILR